MRPILALMMSALAVTSNPVTLAWDATPGDAPIEYRLYRLANPPELVTVTFATSATIDAVPRGSYAVTASAGVESEFSDPVTIPGDWQMLAVTVEASADGETWWPIGYVPATGPRQFVRCRFLIPGVVEVQTSDDLRSWTTLCFLPTTGSQIRNRITP